MLRRTGDEGDSGADGVVRLNSISSRQAVERVYVYGPPSYWDYYATNTSGAALKTVELRPIDLTDASLLLRQLYGGLPADAGRGATVAIIDTGVDGAHPALANVAGGLNCVGDEVRDNPDAAKDWGPAKTEGEHGTHVAGRRTVCRMERRWSRSTFWRRRHAEERFDREQGHQSSGEL